ncbi:BP74-related protein [Agrococcus jejuensis]|uniref:BP74 N-terminal domain-containing protein n=1 Tax=Agrococcus jejuensis TaxID=399736 RepID=A0A1G8DJS6_9MICO|nr:hypothetical protein [Agrococcus jejuensis]SDH57831.1 hypothetical protein SAMN04489720_1671 [Agrococcus jejuensis]
MRRALGILVLPLILGVCACTPGALGPDPSGAPVPSADPSAGPSDGPTVEPSDAPDELEPPVVATFDVGDESFRVELATPELVEQAEAVLAGTSGSTIPNGIVVRDDPSVNEPWSWHIDPATFEFAFQTTEVCDGIPSFVEDETVTSPYFCPWSARLVSLEPLEG